MCDDAYGIGDTFQPPVDSARSLASSPVKGFIVDKKTCVVLF